VVIPNASTRETRISSAVWASLAAGIETAMTDRTTDAVEGTPPVQGTTGLEAQVARGRRSETPFLLVGSTAVVLGAVVAVLAAALLLVWWLA
jgi:hypothetical protein